MRPPGKSVQGAKPTDAICLTLPLYAIGAGMDTGAMGLENPLHIAILLLVVFLVFGAKRLPEFGRSLGSGLREFKSGLTGSLSHPQDSTRPEELIEVDDAAVRPIVSPRS
jgi:sec-independent protein translocase protein TatA